MLTEPSAGHRKSISGIGGHRASYRISGSRKGSVIGRSSSVKPSDRSGRRSISGFDNKSSVFEENEDMLEDQLFDQVKRANNIFSKGLESRS